METLKVKNQKSKVKIGEDQKEADITNR